MTAPKHAVPRLLSASLAGTLLAAAIAPALHAQEAMTLAEVERKYRKMNEVHILKCDYDGDGLYTRTELLCVQSIYRSFYMNDR